MASPSEKYILYHDPFSICSVMVRYTYALRGDLADGVAALDVQDKACDLRGGEHLTEHFLCDINPKGEVPVLVGADGKDIVPDSMDITYLMASRYPSLLPKHHEQEIRNLLERLHQISFFSLTFTGKPERQQKSAAALKGRLESEEGMSEKYRKIIENKMQSVHRRLELLEPQNVEKAIENTKDFFEDIERLLQKSQTGWISNTTQPTALDAHVIVFICRLQDVHRENLIPERVQQYADVAMSQEAWKQTMDGRRTAPPGGF